MNHKDRGKQFTIQLSLVVLWLSCAAYAQQRPAAVEPEAKQATNAPESTRLEQRLDEVLAAVKGMQHQLDDSRQQIDQLQNQLQQMRAQLAAANAETPAVTAEAASELRRNVQQLQDQGEILQAEVKQHDQTKVESASKFPVKISGLVLFSSFLNSGAVDNIDLPIVALPSNTTLPNGNPIASGSLAATFRQSIFGLESTGPMLWGAHSSGDLHVDFFGGTPYADYTTSSGVLRLRTAHAKLDWTNHSLIAALDVPLISRVQPTSYVGIGEPPLAWSGNLWIWLPQLESVNSTSLGAGKLGYDFALLDPAAPGPPGVSGERQPNAAERSRQPAYEARISYSLPIMDRPFTVGAGGYYGRQTYPHSQHVDAWSGTADWKMPFTRWLELSGEFYRGRALGGLGGGTFKDYATDPDTGSIHGLNAEGGWTQLKAKMTRSVEANLAFGEDSAFAQELRYFTNPGTADPYSNLARNRTVLANVIYRPKTYLLFSAEYRNIYSWPVTGQVNTDQSLGLSTGYSF